MRSRISAAARLAAFGAALAIAAAGCGLPAPPGVKRPHAAIAPTLEPLRSAFNADSGRVRVVMLAAPT